MLRAVQQRRSESGAPSGDCAVRGMRWIKKGLRFECQPDCGHCCSQSVFGKGDVEGVFLSKHDVSRLQKAGIAWAIEERGDHRVLSEASGTCVFLDPRTKGCGIYDVRPTQCRNFPFTPGKDSPIATRSQWNKAREHCPGIGIGRYYDKRRIRKLVRDRAQHGSFQI